MPEPKVIEKNQCPNCEHKNTMYYKVIKGKVLKVCCTSKCGYSVETKLDAWSEEL
jgi:transcription elongation factor Elf1